MQGTVRRLAAIVAADVVGYSRRIEADERATLAALKDLFAATIAPLLAEHNGRMVKTMGDGFLAEFGSVVEAVGFAVAMQRAVPERQAGTAPERRLVFRVGINLGDVVVEGDDLFGDGVNVAARLEQLSAPGGVMISGTAYDQLQGKLGLPLDFNGEQQVKNISRPVRTYVVRLAGSGPSRAQIYARGLKRARLPIAAALIALVVVGGTWQWRRRAVLPANPSIAVMPFEDIGGDAATDRLALGVSNEIVTDFSRYRYLDVIASSATAAYPDKGADPRRIAKDLNARYVLKGSIQREGDNIQVRARMFDGATGQVFWSKGWDRPANDVFAVQKEVAESVIAALGDQNILVGLTAAAAHRAPTDLAAYDFYALSYDVFNKGHFAEAEKYADQAIAKDPRFPYGYTLKGWAVNAQANQRGQLGKTISPDVRDQLIWLGRKAIEVDPNEAWSHVYLGAVLRFIGEDLALAEDEIDRALELNPSSADITVIAAAVMSYFGKPELGATLCDRAFRLNPLPPAWYPSSCYVPYYFAKRYQESQDMLRRHLAIFPLTESTEAYLAASQTELGAAEEVANTVADWKRRFPDSTVEALMTTYINFRRSQERDQLLASLRKANAPICVPADKLDKYPTLKHLPLCDAQRAKAAAR